MLKKILKLTFFIITLFLVILLQTSFLGGLNFYSPIFINLPLLFLVIIIFLFNTEKVFLSSLALGFFLDFYTTKFFGFYILLFLVEFFALNFFLENVLQNKSLRSLLVANLVSIVVWFLSHLLYFIIASSYLDLFFNFKELLVPTLFQVLISSLVLFVIFKVLPFGKKLLSAKAL